MTYERTKGISDSKYFDVVLISVCYFWFPFIFWSHEIYWYIFGSLWTTWTECDNLSNTMHIICSISTILNIRYSYLQLIIQFEMIVFNTSSFSAPIDLLFNSSWINLIILTLLVFTFCRKGVQSMLLLYIPSRISQWKQWNDMSLSPWEQIAKTTIKTIFFVHFHQNSIFFLKEWIERRQWPQSSSGGAYSH